MGTFSGFVDFRHPLVTVAGAFFGVTQPLCEGDVTGASPFAMFGNPITHPEETASVDPVSLAARLETLDVRLYAGDGTPCDLEDIRTLATVPLAQLEPFVKQTSDSFHDALTAAGVPHFYDAYGCGIHSRRYKTRDLIAWWPPMMAIVAA